MAAPTRRWLSLGSQAGCCGTLNRSKQRSSSDVGPYFASSIGTCIGAFGHRCFACLRGKLMLSEAAPAHFVHVPWGWVAWPTTWKRLHVDFCCWHL